LFTPALAQRPCELAAGVHDLSLDRALGIAGLRGDLVIAEAEHVKAEDAGLAARKARGPDDGAGLGQQPG